MSKNKLTKGMVEEALMNWSIRFKEKAYTPGELTILAEEYFEDLVDEGFTASLFRDTVKIVRRKAEFFPTMRLILKCRDEVQAKINRQVEGQQQTLPEPEFEDPSRVPYNKLRQDILAQIRKGLDFFAAARCLEIITQEQRMGTPVGDIPGKYQEYSLW